MKRVAKKPKDEKRKQAKYEMNITIEEMKSSEEELRSDLRAIAVEVKRSRSQQVKSDLNSLLRTSKNKRQRLALIGRQRQTLEQHCEALCSVELNEKVMASVKNTSSVLKSLGLSQQVGELDETMMDLQESSEDVQTMNDVLGQSMGLPLISEDELEAELSLLISDEDPTTINTETKTLAVPPTPAVSMQNKDNEPSQQLQREHNAGEYDACVENATAMTT